MTPASGVSCLDGRAPAREGAQPAIEGSRARSPYSRGREKDTDRAGGGFRAVAGGKEAKVHGSG